MKNKKNKLETFFFLFIMFSGFILLLILAVHGLKILFGINIFPEKGLSWLLGM